MTIDNDFPVEEPVGGFALKHGVMLGLISIAISGAIYFAGQMGQQWTGYVTMLIIAVVLYFFQKKFRDELQGGYIRFGKAFGLGFLMYLIAGVLGAIFTYILFTVDTGLLDSLLDMQRQALVESDIPIDTIDSTMEMMEGMFSPGMMLITSLFTSAIGGLIFSLITSAIVKRVHPNEMH